MQSGDLLEIGEVVKPHGLKGGIKAKSYLVSTHTARNLDCVFIGRSKEEAGSYRVKALKTERKILYLELEEIKDAETAGQMVGSRIYISPDKLAKLPEDEYYWHELLGLVVETESGQNLGWIHAIIPGAGHDVYACFDGKREILLPAVAEVIRKVDVAAGVMVVRLPKGL